MLFEILRKLTFPFELLEPYVPKEGKILDVGCGHGIFSQLLASRSPSRFVLGIDPSLPKIESAKKEHFGLSNLSYQVTYLDNLSVGDKYSAISIIDVCYLLTDAEKFETFKKCQELLNKDGVLILAVSGVGKGLIRKALELQEGVMTRVLRLTLSDHAKLNFWDSGQYLHLLEDLGFTIVDSFPIRGILPYPHTVLIARLKSERLL